jgi:drug/metabolite transporter (DMT)-like permease
MKLETVPIIIGALVALLGILMLVDASSDPEYGPLRDRRRRARATVNQTGEWLLGAGAILIGVALIGRDHWRYGTLLVLIGGILLAVGGVLNRRYIKEFLFFRGATRRKPPTQEQQPPKLRIR